MPRQPLWLYRGEYREVNQRFSLAWKHRKCANICICMLCLVVLFIYMPKKIFIFFFFKSELLRVIHFTNEEREKLPHHVSYFCKPCPPCSWGHWHRLWGTKWQHSWWYFLQLSNCCLKKKKGEKRTRKPVRNYSILISRVCGASSVCFPFKTLTMVLGVKLSLEPCCPFFVSLLKHWWYCVSNYSLKPCFPFSVSPLNHWRYWVSNYSLKPCFPFFVSPLKHWWYWESNCSLKPCFPFFFVHFLVGTSLLPCGKLGGLSVARLQQL